MKKLLLIAVFGALMTGCVTEPAQKQEQPAAAQQSTATKQPVSNSELTKTAKQADKIDVTGNLSYRERIALPDNAVIKVTLEDVSLADAKAIVIDTQTYKANGKQVPLPFKVSYQESKINPQHIYNVRAQIFIGKKLAFTTDTAVHVITDFEQTHQTDLQLRSAR
nr:YbaY family lipoprotein [Vibrio gallicus]